MRVRHTVVFAGSLFSADLTSCETGPPPEPYESARSPITSARTPRSASRNAGAGKGRRTFGLTTPALIPSSRSRSAASFAVSAAELRSSTATSASSIR